MAQYRPLEIFSHKHMKMTDFLKLRTVPVPSLAQLFCCKAATLQSLCSPVFGMGNLSSQKMGKVQPGDLCKFTYVAVSKIQEGEAYGLQYIHNTS